MTSDQLNFAPEPPHPDADNVSVRDFLKRFFPWQESDLLPDEVEAEARKFRGNGRVLYDTTAEQFTAMYGLRGGVVYQTVQNGSYAYVSLINYASLSYQILLTTED